MRFLYFIAVLLILFWAIGFLALNLGALIHILLVLAVISILLRLIRGRRI
ncbi:MAG: lmo0937 family membrane protein [Bacteroidales bacterium]